jgi:hypothetical protein
MSNEDSELKKGILFKLNPTMVKKLDRIKKVKNAQDVATKELSRTSIVTEALQEYIDRWEKKHGEIKLS